MKKILCAAICCMTLGLGNVLAQDQMPQGRNTTRGGMRGSAEMIADTTITNHLGISDEQISQINKLNTEYQEKVKEMMTKPNEDGKRLSREDREARMKQIGTQKQEARQQLRKILGDDLYITYLEKRLDQHPMMGAAAGGRMGGGQMGGRRMGGRTMDRMGGEMPQGFEGPQF